MRAVGRFHLVSAGLLMTWLGASACSRPESPLVRRGKEAFTGAVPLKAHMVGHDTALPPSVVRCQNCHSRQAQSPVASAVPSAGASPADSFGPPLDRASLTQPRKRRGGPASSYDSTSFCSLLRDGIDPAHVMIPTTMPRYVVSQEECAALREYLTQP